MIFTPFKVHVYSPRAAVNAGSISPAGNAPVFSPFVSGRPGVIMGPRFALGFQPIGTSVSLHPKAPVLFGAHTEAQPFMTEY